MSATAVVRSFPWGSLDTTTRADEAARGDAQRWAKRHLHVERIEAVLGALLGTRVEMRIRRVRPFAGESPLDDGVGVLLSAADERRDDVGLLLEVEPALAGQVIALAVRRAPPVVVKPSAPPSADIAGAFAAVVMATARRAHVGVAMRPTNAGPAAALEAETARRQAELVAISVTVVLAREAFAARIVVPRRVMTGVDGPAWSLESLSALGDTPLSMPIVACQLGMTAAELAELEPGDALVPSRWPLSRTPGQPLEGPVFLAAPSWPVGHPATLVGDGRLVVGAQGKSLEMAVANMDANERAALVASVGEVPVVVRVEIGEAVMAAREWAVLGLGDVVALGRRVGESVVLRVGGLPVARGELVSIEGEIGVRITERTMGQTAAQ